MSARAAPPAQYLLPCPCGQSIRVTTSQAGATVRCGCGDEVPVPTRSQIQALEPAPPLSSSRPTAGRWTGRHRRLLLGGLVTVVALALFGYTYASCPRLPEIENRPLLSLWPYWQELRQGLDRHPSAWERKYLETVDQSRLGQALWLSVAGLGFAFTAMSFVMRSGKGRKQK